VVFARFCMLLCSFLAALPCEKELLGDALAYLCRQRVLADPKRQSKAEGEREREKGEREEGREREARRVRVPSVSLVRSLEAFSSSCAALSTFPSSCLSVGVGREREGERERGREKIEEGKFSGGRRSLSHSSHESAICTQI